MITLPLRQFYLDNTDSARLKQLSRNLSSTQKESWDSELLHSIQDIFCKALQITHHVFARVWDQAVSMGKLQWPLTRPLTADVLDSMAATFRDTLVYHGKGCQIEPTPGCNEQIQGFLLYLLGRDVFSSAWLDSQLFNAVFVSKNPPLLRMMRKELANILAACAKHLPVTGSPEEVIFQTFVGNCLTMLPYSYPEAGEVYSIPQKVNGTWRMCRYTMDPPIELTPRRIVSPLQAFGLTSKEGPPLLTIIGTTYPAGDGYLMALLSDFTPGMSVGHLPYHLGEKNLQNWLRDKTGVRLFGSSLGGAICFHVLRHNREKISEVSAYNPPGLYPWDWNKPFEQQKINIYYQENDLVPTMGIFPTGPHVSVYRVIGLKAGNSALMAHVRGHYGGKQVTILKSSPEYENSRPIRRFLTAAHCIGTLAIGFGFAATIAILSYLGIRKCLGKR